MARCFVLSYTFRVTPNTRSKYIVHMNDDTVLICDAGGVGAGRGGGRREFPTYVSNGR